ncbi:MAG: exosortase F system-associated protein [Leeuwenhoekiella sp.]
MRNLLKIGLIALLFGVLVLVRMFQDYLFYDPLISFFQLAFIQETALPKMNMGYLLISTSFRYLLNTAISLLILYVAFRDKALLKFAGFLYLSAFLVLIIAFYALVLFHKPENYMVLFYVRRFLIHPLFILILLPAFYYHKLQEK